MRALEILLLAILPVYAAELKIDHVTVAGAKLEAMREVFTAATGLPTEYGGKHANHATEMALSSFADGSYVELMGIQAQADPAAVAAHEWREFLENNAGPCAFAIRPGARVAIAGKGPQRNGRTRPDGTRLEWEISDIGPGIRGTFFPFLIRDLTPRENRAYLKGKPSTDQVMGIARVVVGVRDLEAAIALYRRAFELPLLRYTRKTGSAASAPRKELVSSYAVSRRASAPFALPRKERHAEFGANLAWFEGTPIVLAQGLADDSWLTQRVRKFGEGPCAFVLQPAGGLTGATGSDWFGATIVWTNEQRLGWRLGFLPGL